MAPAVDLFIFGDQTASQEPLLQRIAARKDNGILTAFVQRATSLLRDETGALPHRRRVLMPDFSTLAHLVEAYYSNSTKVPELESSLLIISQLGHFIG